MSVLRQRLLFDVEANGLLPELTRLHSLVIIDLDTDEVLDFASQPGYRPIIEGLKLLAEAALIVGHNIIGYDLPAIKKVYLWWSTKALVRDTIVLTRLMWPHIADSDFKRAEKGTFPKNLIGAQSLKAWGYRLGNQKDEYNGGFEAWTPEMHSYMLQDGSSTLSLWRRIEKEAAAWNVPLEDANPPAKKDCIELEHRVAAICEMVIARGFAFDMSNAVALAAKLTARKIELETELQATFPPKVVAEVFIPKVNNKARGYVKGQPFTKMKAVPFNPGSRQHVAERLQGLGWTPKAFGKDGTPTVDDDILNALPYSEAKLLAEYFTIQKRLGQVSEGKEAWFRHERNGRIHGRITSGGAHTGRMTHSSPNLAQVPANDAPYGAECRACFTASKGMVLVGADASALELCDLAGYMAFWDGGEYINVVLKGDKADKTDIHSRNAALVGCSRTVAKVHFYALIYGSGDFNLGSVLGAPDDKAMSVGKRSRNAIMKGLPALKKLTDSVKGRMETQGFVTGLDGRRLRARSKNAALNTLLQSSGAVQMKRALVILYDDLIGRGWQWSEDFAIVGLIHDEFQAEVKPEKVNDYGLAAVESIRNAGRYYGFKCPLDGEFRAGDSWAATH